MQLRDYFDFSFLTYEPFFPLYVFLSFLLGSLWGSFCNVAIYRMPVGQSTVTPRSYCYSCGSMISGWDNIPLISYLILRGRCRTCRVPFSARYAGIEFISGCLYMALFVQFWFCWALPLYFVFTSLLLIATFTDIDHWIILDRISLGGFVAGVAEGQCRKHRGCPKTDRHVLGSGRYRHGCSGCGGVQRMAERRVRAGRQSPLRR